MSTTTLLIELHENGFRICSAYEDGGMGKYIVDLVEGDDQTVENFKKKYPGAKVFTQDCKDMKWFECSHCPNKEII